MEPDTGQRVFPILQATVLDIEFIILPSTGSARRSLHLEEEGLLDFCETEFPWESTVLGGGEW